jgi:bacteriocin-like protein
MVRPGLMEKIMSFTVRELRDDELQKVSGGLDAGKNEVAVEGVVSVASEVAERQKKQATKMKWDAMHFDVGVR